MQLKLEKTKDELKKTFVKLKHSVEENSASKEHSPRIIQTSSRENLYMNTKRIDIPSRESIKVEAIKNLVYTSTNKRWVYSKNQGQPVV